jgi:hypothetical protein
MLAEFNHCWMATPCESISDDFAHGLIGGIRLSKKPIVNIVSTITNSPGATQQSGFGHLNRSVTQQQLSELIDAIEVVRSSRAIAVMLYRFVVLNGDESVHEAEPYARRDQAKVWPRSCCGIQSRGGPCLSYDQWRRTYFNLETLRENNQKIVVSHEVKVALDELVSAMQDCL